MFRLLNRAGKSQRSVLLLLFMKLKFKQPKMTGENKTLKIFVEKMRLKVHIGKQM